MAENMADNLENYWRSQSFRQSILGKIEEGIRQWGNPTAKSTFVIENDMFQKARTKEEYLGTVAGFILQLKEINILFNCDMIEEQAHICISAANTSNVPINQENSWQLQGFQQMVRQIVWGKIEEAIRQFGNPTSKSSLELEIEMFQTARTKGEYLGSAVRFIIKVKEINILINRDMIEQQVQYYIPSMTENQQIFWQWQSIRENIRRKIEEAFQQWRVPITKSIVQIESEMFQLSKTQDEYLGFVAKLIIHLKEMSTLNPQTLY